MALKEKILERALKYSQKGYLDKAIAEYRSACDVDPRDYSIRLRIGDLCVKLGRNQEAIKEYTEVAKANSQRGFYLKAIAVYKQVLKLEDSLEIHSKLAELYAKQRLIADAVSEYGLIVSAFEKKGRTGDVLDLLKKMIDIDPENVGVRMKLAELYQKLSFDKDALSEYSWVFDRLVQQGKADKAEKIFLTLSNIYSNEPLILERLVGFYKSSGMDQQFLKHAGTLLNLYIEGGDIEAARAVASAIIDVNPRDRESRAFLDGLKGKPLAEALKPAAEAKEETTGAEAPLIDMAMPELEAAAPGPEKQAPEEAPLMEMEEAETAVKEAPEAQAKAGAAEEPLISWPEEEIEITVEGFEEEAPAEPAVEVKPEERAPEPVKEAVEAEAVVPAEAAIAMEEAAEAGIAEGVGEAEVEIRLGGEAGIEIVGKIARPEEAEKAEPAETLEAVVEAAPAALAEEAVEKEPGIEFVDEWLAGGKGAAETFAPQEAYQAEPSAEAEAQVATPLELEVLEAAATAPEPGAQAEPREAEPVEAAPEAEALRAQAGMEEAPENIEQAVEEAFAEPMEARAERPAEEPLIETPEEIAREEALPDEAESFESLMAGPETEDVLELEEAGVPLEARFPEAPERAEPLAAELLDEATGRVRLEEAAVEDRAEEYVDLTAELGMQEALEGMTGSWETNEPKETFDEFKSGISKQLGREDAETHFNLGIAYMEMELYGEAIKEFKIALKSHHLEFDCFARLGLCAMATSNPDEAVAYYQKGLKVEGRSDDERKGMTYDLALAYEASGESAEALNIFMSIYESDPEYREVGKRVRAFAMTRPYIPLHDDMIEVELL